MSKKATHQGTCQACGRVQMLPADTLSLHGYTKQWGWFSGTCFGSRCLPLEISKDLIEVCIKRSEQAIESLQVERSILLQKPTETTKAWKNIRLQDHRGRGDYRWLQGTITAVTYGDTKVTNWTWTGDQTPREVELKTKPLTKEIMSYEMMGMKSVTDVIRKLNQIYVESVVDAGIKNHKSYIQWQRERIKDWVPKPLLPVADEREQALEAARAELEKAGCDRRPAPYGPIRARGWWKGKRYLARDVKHALAALKKIVE